MMTDPFAYLADLIQQIETAAAAARGVAHELARDRLLYTTTEATLIGIGADVRDIRLDLVQARERIARRTAA